MAERYFCPTVRARTWQEAQAQINNRLQLLTRMMDQISTGAGIPGLRIEDGAITSDKIAASQIIVSKLGADAVARLFTLAATKTAIEAWRHASDLTLIDGGDIYAASVTAGKLTIVDLADMANLLTVVSGRIVIGPDALGSGLAGFLLNDGTRDRMKIGEISEGAYAVQIIDAAGVITVDINGRLIKAVRASGDVAASATTETSSSSFVDLANMSVTLVAPQNCTALLSTGGFIHEDSNQGCEIELTYRIDSTDYDSTLLGYGYWPTGGYGHWVGFTVIENLASGSHTFKTRWRQASADRTAACEHRFLQVALFDRA